MSEQPEGDQIPWDVFWYRDPVTRNITENGVTRQELWTPPIRSGHSAPFHFQPNPKSFWEIELKKLLDRTHSIMYAVNGSDIRVWGDGVRLLLPRLWLEDISDDDLSLAIINGINVSLRNRMVLGY